jgi:transposase
MMNDADAGGSGSAFLRPQDIESAMRQIAVLESEVLVLRQLTAQQQEEIRILKERQFGRKSEKFSAEDIRQGKLFNEAEMLSTSPEGEESYETVRISKPVYTRRKRGRKPLSEQLARVEVVVDIGEDEKKAVPEGYELARIGEETSECVHEIPQKYVVIRTVRPKYIVKPLAGSGMPKLADPPRIMIAPVPARILPRSIATPSLLASVLIGKFCDALPFYRQERMFSRFGLDISRQDMANWAIAVAFKLAALIELMKRELLSAPFLHCDETPFQVMDEEGRKNTTLSYMWVLTGGAGTHRVVLFRYNPTREADFISTFLASYEGFLQTDGYVGYIAIGEKDGIIHVACWAHARRRFVEAFKAANRKGIADEAIAFIREMYKAERTLREKYFGEQGSRDADAFVKERKEIVEPVLAELKAWLDAKVLEVLPKSALGTAISYTLELWPRLIRYLDCPWLTPDNNEAERGIRPFTIGRNNWVISGGPRGAGASADLYSLIETIKLNGLEPYFALRYILTRLPETPPDRLADLLPWNLDPAAFHELTAEDARISLASIPIDRREF